MSYLFNIMLPVKDPEGEGRGSFRSNDIRIDPPLAKKLQKSLDQVKSSTHLSVVSVSCGAPKHG